MLCYTTSPPPSQTGGKIKKRQWDGPRYTNRWKISCLHFWLCLPSTSSSTRHPHLIPKHSRSDGRRSASSSSDPPTSSDKCQPPFSQTPPKIASHATIVSIAPQPVLPWCLALFKERPIRHCSGQAAYECQACLLLGRPCQTRPAQYATTKRQSGPSS